MKHKSLPTFRSYASGKALAFKVGAVEVFYSYETPIAFRHRDEPPVVRENEWGPTTGRHMGAIDGGDKSTRIPSEDFERRLLALLPD